MFGCEANAKGKRGTSGLGTKPKNGELSPGDPDGSENGGDDASSSVVVRRPTDCSGRPDADACHLGGGRQTAQEGCATEIERLPTTSSLLLRADPTETTKIGRSP